MSSPSVSPVGLNIARYRKVERLSAADLAERAGEGLTRSVIANLENGRKDDLSLKQLLALARALRVPPTFLVVDMFSPGEQTPYDMPQIQQKVFDPETAQIEEQLSETRNIDFYNYFRGAFNPFPRNAGAAGLVHDLTNALSAQRAAWHRLSRSATHLKSLDSYSDKQDPDYLSEYAQRELDLIVFSTDFFRWCETLESLGVDLGKSLTNARLVLEAFNLPTELSDLEEIVVSAMGDDG